MKDYLFKRQYIYIYNIEHDKAKGKYNDLIPKYHGLNSPLLKFKN